MRKTMALALAASLAAAPIAATAQPSDPPTTIWGHAGSWQIGIDPSVGGCFAEAVYTRPVIYIRFGYDATSGFVILGNPDWRSLDPGMTYDVQVGTNGQKPFTMQAMAFRMAAGTVVLRMNATDPTAMFNAIATAYSVQVSYRSQRLLNGNLTGSAIALRQVLACERANGFSGTYAARSVDPFSQPEQGTPVAPATAPATDPFTHI